MRHGAEWGAAYNVDTPTPTITTKNRLGVCAPYLVAYHGGNGHADRAHAMDAPMPTVDTSNRFGMAQPYIIKYYDTAIGQRVDEPLDTVTTKRERISHISRLI